MKSHKDSAAGDVKYIVLHITENTHLGSTVLGIVILCAIFIVVFLILWILFTWWGLCDQQGENGHQDGVQQLLLQNGLQMGKKNKTTEC